jgi:hypothetical protein
MVCMELVLLQDRDMYDDSCVRLSDPASSTSDWRANEENS